MAGQGLDRTSRFLHVPLAPEVPAAGSDGFAVRKRSSQGSDQAWRQTVTHFTPEPWLVALERDRLGLPIRPGRRPTANR
jgi:hypothetical protein